MQNDIPSLEDVKSHFDHWRATRPKRCKTPSFLWDKVKPIIGHYSLTSITQALRINSGQIAASHGEAKPRASSPR